MKMYHLVEAESLWALSQKGAVNLPQVKTLQDKLRAAGFDPGASDGWYGKKTADAVKAYQEANGLTVDGDAGPQTLEKLGLAGANNTAPRETPPEETPPAPTPRDPIDGGIAPGTTAGGPSRLRQRQQQNPDVEPTTREPEVEPAPTRSEPEPEQTTTREPEAEPETRTEPKTSTNDADSILKGIVNDDPKIKSYTLENNILTLVIDSSINQGYANYRGISGDDTDVEDALDYYGYNDSYRQSLERKIPNLDEIKFEVEGTSTQQPEVTTQEKITSIGTGLDPQSILALFGAIEQGSAKYWTGGLRIDSQNNDAVIVFGSRESTLSDDQLERVGLPRVTYSTYAFSIKKNRGYRLSGRVDYDDIQEAYQAYLRTSVTNQTYALQSGSSQALRRQKIMNWIKSYTPAEEDLERIRSQRESINRIANLAGL